MKAVSITKVSDIILIKSLSFNSKSPVVYFVDIYIYKCIICSFSRIVRRQLGNMPDRCFNSLTPADIERLKDYEVGYDWVPGRFGPPPGILRARKHQLERMNDRDYFATVLRMGQEEKESLMISEAERLRTFKSLWNSNDIVDSKKLAREGFYFTGTSDRVQCAFCAGTLGNWEAGDDPRNLHKQYFHYCKMVTRRPCPNIPIDESRDDIDFSIVNRLDNVHLNGLPHSVTGVESLTNLGIIKDEALSPCYRLMTTRFNSFRLFRHTGYNTVKDMAEAGFYHVGPGDLVECFWCGGTVELWGDETEDAWTIHAKNFPGCGFIHQIKGKAFVKNIWKELSVYEALDLRHNAEIDGYKISDVTFLDVVNFSPELIDVVDTYDSFNVLLELGYPKEELLSVFDRNDNNDFSNIQVLIDAIHASIEFDESRLEAIIESELNYRSNNTSEDEVIEQKDELMEQEFLPVEQLVKSSNSELSDECAAKIIAAMTCSQCEYGEISAVVLPCGHFILCEGCSRWKPPKFCSVCRSEVLATCRTYTC